MKYITDDGIEFSTAAEARAYERQAQRKAKAEAREKKSTAGLVSYLESVLPSADAVAITAAILRDIAGLAEAVRPLLRKKRAPQKPRADKGVPRGPRKQRADAGVPRGPRKGKKASADGDGTRATG